MAMVAAICVFAPSSNFAQFIFGAPGILLTVNNSGDSTDIIPGDGKCADANGQCTLRAAIQESNGSSGAPDAIVFALSWPAVIDLTLGELTISQPVFIVGPGARRLTIQRSQASEIANFRVINLTSFGSTFRGTFTTIHGLSIKNGIAAGSPGGALLISAGSSVRLVDVALANNSAADGGAVANNGRLEIIRSTLNANTASGKGGAILNAPDIATATIANSTITSNSAATGGGIYNAGTMSLVSNTVSHNGASTAASGIYDGGVISVLNTIIGSDVSLPVTSLLGKFYSLGNNIVTDGRGSSGFVNGISHDKVSDNSAIDPLLGDLSNNGGQTDTRALLTGSPAIDAGSDCVFTGFCPGQDRSMVFSMRSDQRIGFSRRAGAAVDVGAFEAGAGPSTGGGGFGFEVTIIRSSNRYLGSLAIATHAVTNAKTYSVVNYHGIARIPNRDPGAAYVLEIRSKRAGLSSVSIVEPQY